MMKVREQIKSLLAQRGMMIKELAELLSHKYGKVYTMNNLSAKMRRGTMTYNEAILIADLLGYDIEFKDRGNFWDN